MPTTRHLIVCEGESEWTYLQRLQSFLDSLPAPDGAFEPALKFIGPRQAVAKGGAFKTIAAAYKSTRTANRKASIQIWADFDLYHRNHAGCADAYAAKPAGIPDFLFSFHNFEDFYALHFDGTQLSAWQRFGSPADTDHFATPLHAAPEGGGGYLAEIQRIFPGYGKGALPPDFVSVASLKNLKANLRHQPKSTPHGFPPVHSFAAFLIDQIDRAYPGLI